MTTQHFCDSGWVDGPVSQCPKHRQNPNAKRVRYGKVARAKMDRDTGVVGVDRGDFISGK